MTLSFSGIPIDMASTCPGPCATPDAIHPHALEAVFGEEIAGKMKRDFLRGLYDKARTSPSPAEREAAWNAYHQTRQAYGLTHNSEVLGFIIGLDSSAISAHVRAAVLTYSRRNVTGNITPRPGRNLLAETMQDDRVMLERQVWA